MIIENLSWMAFNAALAILPALFAWFAYKAKNFLKVIFLVICIAFIPNTIYIVTDLMYVPQQLPLVNGYEAILLLLEYFILEAIGIVTFIFSVYLLERIIAIYIKKSKSYTMMIIVFLNFIISYGVVMGRFQRTNSWEVVNNINKVISDIFAVLLSQHLLFAVIIFGLFTNAVYFLFRGRISKIV